MTIWTQPRCHLRRFKNLVFSHFCIFVPVLGKIKFVFQNHHNHHRLIIQHNAVIRKFEHPTQRGSFNQNDGVGEQPADQVSVNFIDL